MSAVNMSRVCGRSVLIFQFTLELHEDWKSKRRSATVGGRFWPMKQQPKVPSFVVTVCLRDGARHRIRCEWALTKNCCVQRSVHTESIRQQVVVVQIFSFCRITDVNVCSRVASACGWSGLLSRCSNLDWPTVANRFMLFFDLKLIIR